MSNPVFLAREQLGPLFSDTEEVVLRILYTHALRQLIKENPRRWQKVYDTYTNRQASWANKFIAHNKRMADKGIPNAVELVARVTALRMKI